MFRLIGRPPTWTRALYDFRPHACPRSVFTCSCMPIKERWSISNTAFVGLQVTTSWYTWFRTVFMTDRGHQFLLFYTRVSFSSLHMQKIENLFPLNFAFIKADLKWSFIFSQQWKRKLVLALLGRKVHVKLENYFRKQREWDAREKLLMFVFKCKTICDWFNLIVICRVLLIGL